MYTQVEKPKENKNQSVSSGKSQIESRGQYTFQFVDNRPDSVAQKKIQNIADEYCSRQQAVQNKENKTGLPDNFKSGIENLTGYSMDDVKVHYNSDKPAQLQAHAYAQGSDIHLASGQEKHLPHEAWHVVQQKQGRVKSTMQLQSTFEVNDDVGLEKEADVMGANALQVARNDIGRTISQPKNKAISPFPPAGIGQGVIQQFADKYNKKRLEQARLKAKEEKMQLDHSVSQATIKDAANSLKKIKSLSSNKNNLFKKLHSSYIKLVDEIESLPEADDHDNNIRTTLLNLRANLTPGYVLTTGNPGSGFDPQIFTDNNQSEFTVASGHLLTFDNSARELVRLSNLLPFAHLASQIMHYNKRLDEAVAKELDSMTLCLNELSKVSDPVFDEDDWYEFKQKKVKRISADWETTKPVNLGRNKKDYSQLNLAESTHTWNYTVTSLVVKERNAELEDDGNIEGENTYERDTTVIVNVKIPVTCWKHIYDRHTIENFAGDVQAINSFWKVDPQIAITTQLLKPDVELLVDRKFDLRNLLEMDRDEKDSGNEDESVNEFVNKLFFQRNIEIYPDWQNDKIDIDFTTKSIAPQDNSLATAIEPSVLMA